MLLWFAFLQHSMEKHTVPNFCTSFFRLIFFSLNKPTNLSMHYFVVDNFVPGWSLSQGCAFIQYVDSACAERAIKQLHGKVSKLMGPVQKLIMVVTLNSLLGDFLRVGAESFCLNFQQILQKSSAQTFVTILKVRVVNGWLTHGDFWEVGWKLQFKNSTMA